jgi:hypothetical protein
MSSGAKQLAQARAARDLKSQSIGERIKQRLRNDAISGLYRAADVASESKGLIFGTVAIMALWLLRHPIIAWFKRQRADEESDDEDGGEVDDKADYHEVHFHE